MVGGGGCVAVGPLARPQGTSSWSHLLPGSCFAPAGPLGLRERLGAPRDEFFFLWLGIGALGLRRVPGTSCTRGCFCP